jgi:hypothetical protein
MFLAEELINNTYDEPVQGRRSASRRSPGGSPVLGMGGSVGGGLGPHLTPTKKKGKERMEASQTICIKAAAKFVHQNR